MVLPGRASDLRALHLHAGEQMLKLFQHFGFDTGHPNVAAELAAWQGPPQYARTLDRSLLGTLDRVTFEAWHHFAHFNRSLPEAAARQWLGLFTHPALPRHPRIRSNAWRPIELVQARLLPGNEPDNAAHQRARLHLMWDSNKPH